MPKLEPIPSANGRMGGRRGRAARVSTSLAEINVVPLVDVMLVLLVIFMVAAPMMKQGFPVRLPEAKKAQPINGPVTVTVPAAFRKDHRVQIDGTWVTLQNLDERIKQAIENHADKAVVVEEDGSITANDQALILSQLKVGGVENAGLQVQPPTGIPAQ